MKTILISLFLAIAIPFGYALFTPLFVVMILLFIGYSLMKRIIQK